MGKMKIMATMACTTMLVACNQQKAIEQQVDELYGRMSQEERIAQLRSIYMDDLFDQNGQLDTAQCRKIMQVRILNLLITSEKKLLPCSNGL